MRLISGILPCNIKSIMFLHDKNYFLLIPIDLSTAFDIVAHQILLKKLLFYGISNETFK